MNEAAAQPIQDLDGSNLFSRYREGLIAIEKLARREGYQIQAFTHGGEASSAFHALPMEQKISITDSVENFVSVCNAVTRDGLNLRDGGPMLAWSALRALRLKPASDLFSHIHEGDVIEIYDASNVQIFRSFNFFSCLSYTLDQVTSHQWWDLYDRDENVTNLMRKTVTLAFEQANRHVFVEPFPKHLVVEKFSPRQKRAEINTRAVGLLFKENGAIGGFAHVFRLLTDPSNA